MAIRRTHTHTNFESGVPFATAWTGQDGLNRVDFGADVIAFSSSKSVDSTTGQFELTLSPRGDGPHGELRMRTYEEKLPFYYNLLDKNTPIALGYDSAGGIMFGLVESRSYTGSVINNELRVAIKVTCTDLGHLLDDQILCQQLTTGDNDKWTRAIRAILGDGAPLLRELMGAEGPVDSAGNRGLLNVTVEQVARYILDRVQGARIPVLQDVFGGNGTLGDFCELQVTSFADDRVWRFDMQLQEGTIGSYLSGILDPDFYEFRIETVTRGDLRLLPHVYLIIRPKPYDEAAFQSPAWPSIPSSPDSQWERLTTLERGRQHHVISIADLAGPLDLGNDRSSALTFYTVQNENELAVNQNASSGTAFPILDMYNAKRYISKRYDSRCSLVSDDANDPSKPQDTVETRIHTSLQARRNRLFCWRRAEPDMMAGTITVAGKDEYKAGDPVLIDWLTDSLSGQRGVRFYVSSVQHSWQFGGRFVTTLSLIRGHGPGFFDAFLTRVKAMMPAAYPYGWVSADR